MLRPRVQVRERRRPRRLEAERLVDRRGELRRQCGLQADERHTRDTALAPDIDAVRRMRIDDHAVTTMSVADRRDAVTVRAATGNETRRTYPRPHRRGGDVEFAVAFERAPKLRQRIRITRSDVEHEA